MAKIFGTDGVRSKVNAEPMTTETCLKIARSVGHILSKKHEINRVVISKDTRLSGYVFEPVIASGFSSMGSEVLLVGPLPTPALAMLVGTLRADIGIMITASHNTFEYNGLKIFDKDGNKIPQELENQIEEIIFNEDKYNLIIQKNLITGKTKRLEDAVGRYTESIKNSFPKNKSLKGLKIVIDCANGANYKVAPEVLWELGSDVVTIENSPNGKNINLNCGAVNPSKLSQKVISENADIGFAFDGDGDRLIVVDENGEIMDGDKIVALLATEFLKQKKLKNGLVVSTHMSNMAFEKYINKIGLNLIRTQVGDKYVIEKMRETNASIGGEQSGHIIIKDYSKTGDGLLVAVQISNILISSNKKTSEIFDLYEALPQVQTSVEVIDKNKSFYKNKDLQKFIMNFNDQNDNLRLLIRPSGTEPVIRILVEGNNLESLKSISNEVQKMIVG
ncbi:MAG: phosphoglucosamine mutase [Pelagibacteraceae bacterium]|nr:phosphoglucosamine mutase [Pelagibacteraceae bacterium]|tara:strand:+ start:23833 stop:25176 length:1344 start_codon:yes stop_codon:yes gene_type:complete